MVMKNWWKNNPKSIRRTARQIASNAGLEPAVIIEKIKTSQPGVGFDAANNTYVDMKKAGNSRSYKSFKKCTSKRSINCINDPYNRKLSYR